MSKAKGIDRPTPVRGGLRRMSRARWLTMIEILAPAEVPKMRKPLEGSAPSDELLEAAYAAVVRSIPCQNS